MSYSKPSTPQTQNHRQSASPYARRFSKEQREHALSLLALGHPPTRVAKIIGTTTKTLSNWQKQAGGIQQMAGMKSTPTAPETGTPVTQSGSIQHPSSPGRVNEPAEQQSGPAQTLSPPYRPQPTTGGITEIEQAAIIELKQKHPSMGPAQIKAQLMRFKKWRISIRVINRVLRQHGYEGVHKGSRPKDVEYKRFEAPRPNSLWQLDFAPFRVAGDKLHLLVALDDFSRFAVGHLFGEEQSSRVATELLEGAMARYGKPESIRTDRGGAFLAKTDHDDFAKRCEAHCIDHIVGRPYHPQGGGKVESLIGTIRRELWDVEHFESRSRAEQRTAEFFDHYNHRRAHMGIDGLTPADRYFGRGDQVLDRILAVSRKRTHLLSSTMGPNTPFEECQSETPTEVLRLAIVEGEMELRFCGARIPLGKVQS
jgi:transposase InsO family protein